MGNGAGAAVTALAHTLHSALLACLGAQLDFLEDGYYLAFTESGFLHVETTLVGTPYFYMA